MKEKIINYLVSTLITNFLQSLSPGDLRVTLDKYIDIVEDYVASTGNQVDDNLIPVLAFARDLFGIPDLPDSKR